MEHLGVIIFCHRQQSNQRDDFRCCTVEAMRRQGVCARRTNVDNEDRERPYMGMQHESVTRHHLQRGAQN